MKSRHGTKRKGRKYNPRSCLTKFLLGHFGFFAWKQTPVRQGFNAQALEMKCTCPGFIWDRANCHNKRAGLTQTANPMGYSIPCDAMLSI